MAHLLSLRWIWLGCLLLCCMSAGFGEIAQGDALDPKSEFAAGAEAYRSGDYAAAKARWIAILEQEGGDARTSDRRGRLCFNLGNAAYRSGESMEAVAWYQAAKRHLPRDRDVLTNLSYVRSEMGLSPPDGDSMFSVLRHVVSAWTPAEARKIALMSLALLALVLGMEALRGGALWRRLSWLGIGAVILCWIPWMLHALDTEEPRSMVAAERAISGRSQPRPDGRALVRLEPTSIVFPVDEWQDWSKVRTAEGKDVWVQTDKIHSVWY